MRDMKNFRITGGKGFQMTFPNGYTVSVQFGPGNYCDRNNSRFDEPAQAIENGSVFGAWDADTAEVAIMDSNGSFVRLDGWMDDVIGWQSPTDVLQIIQKAKKLDESVSTKDD